MVIFTASFTSPSKLTSIPSVMQKDKQFYGACLVSEMIIYHIIQVLQMCILLLRGKGMLLRKFFLFFFVVQHSSVSDSDLFAAGVLINTRKETRVDQVQHGSPVSRVEP